MLSAVPRIRLTTDRGRSLPRHLHFPFVACMPRDPAPSSDRPQSASKTLLFLLLALDPDSLQVVITILLSNGALTLPPSLLRLGTL